MAIMTRWRMPPESWWGYWLEPLFGPRHPDQARAPRRGPFRPRLGALRCIRTGSAIWLPICIVGFREVIGSWKIIATSFSGRLASGPRAVPQVLAAELDAAARRCDRLGEQLHDRQPRRGLAAARLADEADGLTVVDAESETPSTARTFAVRRWNSVWRFSTSRTGVSTTVPTAGADIDPPLCSRSSYWFDIAWTQPGTRC